MTLYFIFEDLLNTMWGAQSLSSRVLDPRSRDCGFNAASLEALRCVLGQDTYPLHSTGSAQEDPSQYDRKIID